MDAFPAIVGGAHLYAFIFTHGCYQLLEGMACCLQHNSCTAVTDKLHVLFSS